MKNDLFKEPWGFRHIINRIYLFVLVGFAVVMFLLFQSDLMEKSGATPIAIIAILVISQFIAWLDLDKANKKRRIVAAVLTGIVWFFVGLFFCGVIYDSGLAFQSLSIPELDTWLSLRDSIRYFGGYSILIAVLGGLLQYVLGTVITVLVYLLGFEDYGDSVEGYATLLLIELRRAQLFVVKGFFLMAITGGFGLYVFNPRIDAFIHRHHTGVLIFFSILILRILAVLGARAWDNRNRTKNAIAFWVSVLELFAGNWIFWKGIQGSWGFRLRSFPLTVTISGVVLVFILLGISEINYLRKVSRR